MTSAADISPGLASALAAASLASQQAQRAADAFDAKAGLSAIPAQHWELLRVAELLTKGLNMQQHMGVTGLANSNPPPLFLPSLAAHQGVDAVPAGKAPLQPNGAGQAGGFPSAALPVSVSAAMAGVTSAGLQMALASATQVCLPLVAIRGITALTVVPSPTSPLAASMLFPTQPGRHASGLPDS